jgi:hypothetical protein
MHPNDAAKGEVGVDRARHAAVVARPMSSTHSESRLAACPMSDVPGGAFANVSGRFVAVIQLESDGGSFVGPSRSNDLSNERFVFIAAVDTCTDTPACFNCTLERVHRTKAARAA